MIRVFDGRTGKTSWIEDVRKIFRKHIIFLIKNKPEEIDQDYCRWGDEGPV